MDSIIPFIVFCQALGALVGATTTVGGELAYLRARKDGHIDAAERAHLRIIAHGLRFGMTLLLIASFALVIVAYLLQTRTQPAVTPAYWMLIVAALVVVYVSWALSRRKISFAVGSAIAFTGWWFLAYLTIGWLPSLTLGATVGFLVVATAMFYGILGYARMLTHPKPRTEPS
jgi:hypothetical protein